MNELGPPDAQSVNLEREILGLTDFPRAVGDDIRINTPEAGL